AGVVALVAVRCGPLSHAVDVGVDVVCAAERRARDLDMIREARDGGSWAHFVDVHADVLAPAEVRYLKSCDMPALQPRLPRPPPRGGGERGRAGGWHGDGDGDFGDDDGDVDVRLRAFYALWCLREAYVKMTGEALLAPWLAELEFRRFRAPAPGPAAA